MKKEKRKKVKAKNKLQGMTTSMAIKEAKKADKFLTKKFDAKKHWVGMPEFVQNNVGAFKKITVNFANDGDVREFFKRINQTYTPKTRSIWFSDAGIDKFQSKRYASKK